MDQAAAPASVMQSRDEPLRLEGPRTTRSGRTVKPPQCAGCILCIKTLFQYYLFCILEICSLHNIVGSSCFVRFSEIPEKGFIQKREM